MTNTNEKTLRQKFNRLGYLLVTAPDGYMIVNIENGTIAAGYGYILDLDDAAEYAVRIDF